MNTLCKPAIFTAHLALAVFGVAFCISALSSMAADNERKASANRPGEGLDVRRLTDHDDEDDDDDENDEDDDDDERKDSAGKKGERQLKPGPDAKRGDAVRREHDNDVRPGSERAPHLEARIRELEQEVQKRDNIIREMRGKPENRERQESPENQKRRNPFRAQEQEYAKQNEALQRRVEELSQSMREVHGEMQRMQNVINQLQKSSAGAQ